jgi:hypothetical protein
VRLLEARNESRRPRYRDGYHKFSYSSHFPFNYISREDRSTWDQALVFRDLQTNLCYGRSGIKSGALTAGGGGAETVWWAQLGDSRFEVVTQITLDGEFEKRTHIVTAPAAALNKVEILEGSSVLGLMDNESYERAAAPPRGQILRSPHSKLLIVSWNIAGFDRLEATETFDKDVPANVNVIYPRMVINTLRKQLTSERTTLVSLHYASPRPLKMRELRRQAARLTAG